jgi:multidrug efflux pump subunit AcrA (membrane-fusion protein)
MIGINLRNAVLPLIVAVLLVGCGKREVSAPVPPTPPPVVLVAEAVPAQVPIFTDAIATLDGSTATPVHSPVAGYLIKQASPDGAVVKPGDLLFEIDPRPFQQEGGAVNPSMTKGKDSAAYLRIVAPIAGVAGRSNPGVGDAISPTTILTTIATVDPMTAEFFIPMSSYQAQAGELARELTLPSGQRPERLELLLADGTVYPRRGKIGGVVKPSRPVGKGAVTVRALFPNPDGILRPGQYAQVHELPQQLDGAVLVPQECVRLGQGNDAVMVVRSDGTVEMRNVTKGDQAGSDWTITSGLKAGEHVIVVGGENAQAGMRVTPEPYASSSSQAPSRSPGNR